MMDDFNTQQTNLDVKRSMIAVVAFSLALGCGVATIPACSTMNQASKLSSNQAIIVECTGAATTINDLSPYVKKMSQTDLIIMRTSINTIEPVCEANPIPNLATAQQDALDGAALSISNLLSQYTQQQGVKP